MNMMDDKNIKYNSSQPDSKITVVEFDVPTTDKTNVDSQVGMDSGIPSDPYDSLPKDDKNNTSRKKLLIIGGTLMLIAAALTIGYIFISNKNSPKILNNTNKWIGQETESWSAKFPYGPSLVKSNLSASTTQTTYRTKSADNKNSYQVSILENSIDKNSSQDNLEATLKSIDEETSERKSIVTTNKKYLNINGIPAVDFTQTYVQNGEELVLRSRTLADRNKIYFVQTYGLSQEAINSDFFIDNFTLR